MKERLLFFLYKVSVILIMVKEYLGEKLVVSS